MTNKNNYAFEIRFVNDNVSRKVQVFDIAAKRQQKENTGALLPAEYTEEEVLKGQLRYSKLVGGESSINMLGSFEDNGELYQHQVATKKSSNRRSIQRHTMFMMGGGGGGRGDENINYNTYEVYDDTYQKQQDQDIMVTQAAASAPPSPTPSLLLSPTSSHNKTILFPTPPQELQEPLPAAILSHEKHHAETTMYHQQAVNVEINRMPSNIPQPQKQQQQYYTEDYTSMTIIDTNDYDSKRHMQSSEERLEKKERKGGCCIIS